MVYETTLVNLQVTRGRSPLITVTMGTVGEDKVGWIKLVQETRDLAHKAIDRGVPNITVEDKGLRGMASEMVQWMQGSLEMRPARLVHASAQASDREDFLVASVGQPDKMSL